jgi:hypothetical protein
MSLQVFHEIELPVVVSLVVCLFVSFAGNYRSSVLTS